MTKSPDPMVRVAFGMLAYCLMLLSGCHIQRSAGSLRAQGLGDDPALLSGDFRRAYFSNDSSTGPSFMLFDVPIDGVVQGNVQNGQILHIDLLWLPKPGATPLENDATNATIRYVVISHGEIGVYGGAGFAMPDGSPDDKKLGLTFARSLAAVAGRDAWFCRSAQPGPTHRHIHSNAR